MSAARLREAAALMRSRASRASRVNESEGRWSASWDHQVTAADGEQLADCFDSGLLAEHFASWHPAVALAVADWLDAEAGAVEFDGGRPDLLSTQAIAVANAYLGGAQ